MESNVKRLRTRSERTLTIEAQEPPSLLSKQESQILRKLMSGMSLPEIADNDAMREPEIKAHIKALLLKLKKTSETRVIRFPSER